MDTSTQYDTTDMVTRFLAWTMGIVGVAAWLLGFSALFLQSIWTPVFGAGAAAAAASVVLALAALVLRWKHKTLREAAIAVALVNTCIAGLLFFAFVGSMMHSH